MLFQNVYTDKLKKNDGIISLLVLLLYAGYLYLTLKIIPTDNQYHLRTTLLTIPWIFLLLIIPILKKQSLQTVGLNKRISPIIACLLATATVFVIAFYKEDTSLIIRWLFSFIAVGAIEELLMRGFVYPRLLVLTNNYFSSIVIAGGIFGAYHHISAMVWNHVHFLGVLSQIGGGILGHCFFLLVMIKSGSILNAILLHSIMNFSENIPWPFTLACVLYVIYSMFAPSIRRVLKNNKI